MAEQFHDVKTRQQVSIPENKLKKTTYRGTTKSGAVQVSYALRGKLPDGRTLTKFVKKETWKRYLYLCTLSLQFLLVASGSE